MSKNYKVAAKKNAETIKLAMAMQSIVNVESLEEGEGSHSK